MGSQHIIARAYVSTKKNYTYALMLYKPIHHATCTNINDYNIDIIHMMHMHKHIPA